MSLADRLAEYPAADEPQYTPRTEFDGTSGFIQTASFRANEAPDFTAILTQFGYDPEKVRIVGEPRVSRWQQRARLRDENGRPTNEWETVWLCAYRFHIAAIAQQAVSDLDALVKAARKRARAEAAPDGHWFVFQAGDQQLGKRASGGSTDQIVDTYISSVEEAVQQFKQLKRHGIAGIQVSFPGDCIEGNQSQSGRNLWLTQETITEQTRILRRLMFHTLESLAPLTDQLYLDVVNGNHDQAQRQQNTYPGDGWATECAIAVSDALQLNPTAFGHVEVRVPDKWRGMMTVPVGDSAVTVVHGHQWRRNQAMTWWANQAVNNQPAGGSQIIQHGHWHEFRIESNANRTVIGSPTFDCGSDWYHEKTGATSRRGGLTYLLRSGEVSRLTVV